MRMPPGTRRNVPPLRLVSPGDARGSTDVREGDKEPPRREVTEAGGPVLCIPAWLHFTRRAYQARGGSHLPVRVRSRHARIIRFAADTAAGGNRASSAGGQIP